MDDGPPPVSSQAGPAARRRPLPLRTCVRVDQGRSLRALPAGARLRQRTLIRSAAAELPRVSLEDALRICMALRKEPEIYERAVVRWLGRFCLERRDVTLTTVRVALEALERLPRALDEASAQLRRLARL